jgi:group I intron endonuclease
MDEKIYYVYRHTAPNGKVYIGITSQNPKQRFKGGHGYWHNKYFSRAISLYGWDNIKHDILKTGLTREQAIVTEKALIAEYDSANYRNGYNLMTGGDGVGRHTQETIEYLRKINTGRFWTEEHRELHRQKMTGHTLSAESREKISQKRMGKMNPFYGKKHTEETKRKIRENAPRPLGEKSVNAKGVIQYDTGGNKINAYGAISTAAKENNIPNPYNISACCRGKLKTAYGYVWRYADETILNEVRS